VIELVQALEHEALDDDAREKLQKELKKQIAASREIRAIIYAHDELNKSLKEKLHDEAERLRKLGPTVKEELLTGSPYEKLIDAGHFSSTRLIVVSSLGLIAPSRFLVGSVAETVVREALCPVLLKRPVDDPLHRILRRILVPLDGSAESLAIVPAVKTLALRTQAEVVFLQLSEEALAPSPRAGLSAEVRVVPDPRARLLSLKDLLAKSDLVYWQTLGGGDAVEEILEHARTLEADLIAMSTQAGGDLDRTLVGGVAMAVVGVVLCSKSRACLSIAELALQYANAHCISGSVIRPASS
jgi:nucleotide-binding universal stress UspA family protein